MKDRIREILRKAKKKGGKIGEKRVMMGCRV